jgi:hypothetical protein
MVERDLFVARFQTTHYGETSGTNGRSEADARRLSRSDVATCASFQKRSTRPRIRSPVLLLAIGGDCEETLNAALILHDEKRNRWLTVTRPQEFRTSNGTKISKQRVIDAMYAPGDGRVTRASLLGETIFKTRDTQNRFHSLALRCLWLRSSRTASAQQVTTRQRPHRHRRRSIQ